jgi:hypothetical protein
VIGAIIGTVATVAVIENWKTITEVFSKQDKKLSKGEVEKLKKAGIDVEDLKEQLGGKPSGRFDLFKDKKGNIKVKPKSGRGPGEPTDLNINNYYSAAISGDEETVNKTIFGFCK